MKCPICRGSMKKGRTNLPVEIGEGLLFVKNVPADICSQYGEAFIPDKVANLLEKMVNKVKPAISIWELFPTKKLHNSYLSFFLLPWIL